MSYTATPRSIHARLARVLGRLIRAAELVEALEEAELIESRECWTEVAEWRPLRRPPQRTYWPTQYGR